MEVRSRSSGGAGEGRFPGRADVPPRRLIEVNCWNQNPDSIRCLRMGPERARRQESRFGGERLPPRPSPPAKNVPSGHGQLSARVLRGDGESAAGCPPGALQPFLRRSRAPAPSPQSPVGPMPLQSPPRSPESPGLDCGKSRSDHDITNTEEGTMGAAAALWVREVVEEPYQADPSGGRWSRGRQHRGAARRDRDPVGPHRRRNPAPARPDREVRPAAGLGAGGLATCAHWLSVWTGIDRGAAREKVRVARALTALPLTSAAMAKGELSFSQVRALSRVASPPPDDEEERADLGVQPPSDQIHHPPHPERSRGCARRGARARRRPRPSALPSSTRGSSARAGRSSTRVRAPASRSCVRSRGAGGALFRKRTADGSAEAAPETAPTPATSDREAAQRRADAIGLRAERALSAGFGEEGRDTISGARAKRYQVLIHVDADTLTAEGEPGRGELEDGTRVSAETSRRLGCDGSLVRIAQKPDGSVLDVGAPSRCGTGGAASRAAAAASPMRITCGTGPTAERPASTTPCCSAGTITGSCTRTGGGSTGGGGGAPHSRILAAAFTSRGGDSHRSSPSGRSRP